MKNGTITMEDGRNVGFADYGTPDQTAVLWCHGGPGSRHEPSWVSDEAARACLRLIGIDRPGYGLSTPQPGRTIGGWVPDATAVADHLNIDRFAVIGVSTGGAYALAVAASSPRVIGAIACCAVSDMRWVEGKVMTASCHPVWTARTRVEALAITTLLFGERGEKLLPPLGPVFVGEPDQSLPASPDFLAWWIGVVPYMFTHGAAGFADDRLADAVGWGSFDVANIRCPVTVLHGSSDGLVPIATARHTAGIVPGATLRIIDDLGHMTILTRVVEVMTELLAKTEVIS